MLRRVLAVCVALLACLQLTSAQYLKHSGSTDPAHARRQTQSGGACAEASRRQTRSQRHLECR